jgi:hypothetical protein
MLRLRLGLILRLMLWLVLLRLMLVMLIVLLMRLVLRLARVERLRLRRIGLATHLRLVVAVVEAVVG